MISLSTGALWPYGLARIFQIAKDAEFDALELVLVSKSSNAHIDTWDSDYVNQLIDKHRIPVLSVHAHFEFESEPNNFLEIANLSNKIKAKTIIIHIPREDQLEYIKWFDYNYYSYNNNNFALLAENVHHKIGKADPILTKINDFKKLPKMCFDIAHALRSDVDPEKAIAKLDNIMQLHLSEWDGKEDHMSILNRKKYYSDLLSIKKIDNICLELCPKIFNDIADRNEIVEKLHDELNFVKKVIN